MLHISWTLNTTDVMEQTKVNFSHFFLFISSYVLLQPTAKQQLKKVLFSATLLNALLENESVPMFNNLRVNFIMYS